MSIIKLLFRRQVEYRVKGLLVTIIIMGKDYAEKGTGHLEVELKAEER